MQVRPARRSRRAGRTLGSPLVVGFALAFLLSGCSHSATNAGASTPSISTADVLLDLMQPGATQPYFLDPGAASPKSIAEAVAIEQYSGEPVTADAANTVVLSNFLSSLTPADTSEATLLTALDTLEAARAAGVDLAAATRQGSLKAYLGQVNVAFNGSYGLLDGLAAEASALGTAGASGLPASTESSLTALAARTAAQSCGELQELSHSTDPAVLGTLIEIATDVRQNCLNPQTLDATFRKEYKAQKSPTISAITAMARLQIEHISPTPAPTTTFSRSYSEGMAAIDAQISQSDTHSCPLSEIEPTAVIGAAAGGASREMPSAVLACVQRTLRWHGALPDQESASPISAAFAVATLRTFQLNRDQAGVVDAALAAVDYRALSSDPRTSLITALADDPEKITSVLVSAFEKEYAATPEDILLLAASSSALGHCDAFASHALTAWMTDMLSGHPALFSLLWTLATTEDASVCAGPDTRHLAAVASHVVASYRSITASDKKASDSGIDKWLTLEAGCALPSAAKTMTDAALVAQHRGNWDEMVGTNPQSILSYFAQARALQITQFGCVPSWLTPNLGHH